MGSRTIISWALRTLLLIFLAASSVAANAYTLSGIVRGGQDPLQGATVTLRTSSGVSVQTNVVTGADGAYAFNDLGDGEYVVDAFPPDDSFYSASTDNAVTISWRGA